VRLLLILALLWLLGTCRSAPPEVTGDPSWTIWTNVAAGYSLEVPDVYEAAVHDEGNAVFFRWRSTTPAKVYVTDLDSAKRHGLWADEAPTGPATLAGQPGTRYDYTHCDGPICSRMTSFVVPRGSLWLALEFRSDGELSAVNQRILASFTVLPSERAD
jgi:hypothetical protein